MRSWEQSAQSWNSFPGSELKSADGLVPWTSAQPCTLPLKLMMMMRRRILKMMMAILANFNSSANKLLENSWGLQYSRKTMPQNIEKDLKSDGERGWDVLGLNWGYLTWWEGKLEHKRRDRCRIGSRAEFRAPELGRECRGSVTRG